MPSMHLRHVRVLIQKLWHLEVRGEAAVVLEHGVTVVEVLRVHAAQGWMLV